MSALPEIVVDPERLSEGNLFELMRLNALDGDHAIAHKRLMEQGSCKTCRAIRADMEKLAAGGTTEMATMTEQVARALAPLWGDELTSAGRDVYRRRAVDLLTELDGRCGLTLPVTADVVF